MSRMTDREVRRVGDDTVWIDNPATPSSARWDALVTHPMTLEQMVARIRVDKDTGSVGVEH